MMIGSNVFDLNEATMIAALQHYFDTVVFADGKSPHVKSISKPNTYDSAFRVTVEEKSKPS